MKRALAITVGLLLLLCGCSSTTISTTSGPSTESIVPASTNPLNEKAQGYKDLILSTIKDTTSYADIAVEVSQSDSEKFSVTAHLEQGTDIALFGNNCHLLLSAVEETIASPLVASVTIFLSDKDGETVLLFTRVGENTYGAITDTRSGDSETTLLSSVDDLADTFPALHELLGQDSLSPDDLAIYDAVMAALDKSPHTPEDKIFEEMAPSYDMTSAELKQFILEMMEKVYS